MAADKEDTVYNSRTLSKWFAISSIALLIVVVWAVINDYDREWKSYMRQSHKITATISQLKLIKAQKDTDTKKLEEVNKKLAVLKSEQEKVVEEIDDSIKELSDDFYYKNQKYQTLKAKQDAMLYALDHAVAEQKSYAQDTMAKYNKLAAKVSALKKEADDAERKVNEAKAKKNEIIANQKELETEIFRMTSEQTRLQKAIVQNNDNLGYALRNAPLVDFVTPTVKIQQVVLPHLKDNYFFNKVERVDRCMSCHAFADKQGYEDMPQPFRTHPNLELMVGPDSPHPVQKIGCTVCHSGVPQSVDFNKTAHVPNSDLQEAEWEEKYGFYRNTHIKTHMIPTDMVEGKCIQCHANEIQLDKAPTFNAGMRLVEKLGCWGCHKFADTHFQDMYEAGKRVGPPLLRVSTKVEKDWMQKWIWEPSAYRPSTLMPHYWKQHNNSDPESMRRGAVEVTAITEYLLAKSKDDFEPIQLASNVVGDVAKGKELVGSVGCLGCHASDDFPVEAVTDPEMPGYKDPRLPMFGPELNQMGSKVTKEWLVSWLIKPSHYWADTSMPSMKLTDKEAADIAEYLLSKRNEKFDLAPSPLEEVGVDTVEYQERVAEMSLDYFNQTLAPEEAETKLASMSLKEQEVFLGEKLINHYGCYGCHAIEGFSDAPQIGAELTYEGSKDISKFDFGFIHLPKTSREEWIYTKIRTPRVWDVGKKKDFAGKTRMPNFNLNAAKSKAITAIVIGHEEKNVMDEAMPKMDARKEAIIAGQREVRAKNCIGCHAITGMDGGEILAHYQSDPTNGPPNLNTEGAKLQPDWFAAYLANPNVEIRPWMKARMPQYYLEKDKIETIVHHFAAYDHAEYPMIGKQSNLLSSDEFRQAQEIVNKLACISCHANVPAGADPQAYAPLFKNVKVRLRGTWIPAWLADPQAIMPGTRMPALWPLLDEDDPSKGRIAVPGYFNDDADLQMEKVRDYLFMLQERPTLPAKRELLPEEDKVDNFKLNAR